MIQGLQKTFRAILSQQKNICFINQKSWVTRRSFNLNYIPTCKFGNTKNFNYILSSQRGIIQLKDNKSFNQISKEWQEEIYDKIENFQQLDAQGCLDTFFFIENFIQLYLENWVNESEKLLSIDKNIFDFIEVISELIQSQLKDEEIDSLKSLRLRKFQIQVKFLRSFDQMGYSEKIQLFSNYKDLHQRTLEILPVNPELEKIVSYIQAETLSVYVAMQWMKNIDNFNRDQINQIFIYALVQIQQILEETWKSDEENEIKTQRFMYSTWKQKFLFQRFGFFGELDNDKNGIKVLLDFMNQNEKHIENFKNLLIVEEYKRQKLHNCMNFIKLGYIDAALKSALSFFDLRFQKDSFQVTHYSILYYCLKKTQNTTNKLEELIQEIRNSDYGSELVISNFNHLILLQDLHKLISEEKYNQSKPIIDQLIHSLDLDSESSKFLIFPLFAETIINNPKIPNRQDYSKQVAQKLISANYSDQSGIYLNIKKSLYFSVLTWIAVLERDDQSGEIISSGIRKLFKLSQSDNFLKEGVNLIIKLIPQIESVKTYKNLIEIIDPLIVSLQKDQNQEENKKLIEILNSHKDEMSLKYYKPQQ